MDIGSRLVVLVKKDFIELAHVHHFAALLALIKVPFLVWIKACPLLTCHRLTMPVIGPRVKRNGNAGKVASALSLKTQSAETAMR